jgi:hypothetical protein
MNGRLRRVLSELRRSERGIALPMALMVTVVGMGLAAVPIVASVNSQSGDQRNQGANEALAAAETGSEIALAAQGTLHIKKGSDQLCVSEPEAAPATGWCPQEPINMATTELAAGTVGLAHYTYRVLPCYGIGAGFSGCGSVIAAAACNEGDDPVQVVSTGTATVAGREVERRVSVEGCAASFSLPPGWNETKLKIEENIATFEREIKLLKVPREPKEHERTEWERERKRLEEAIEKEIAEGKKSTETKTVTTYKTVEHEVAPAVFSGGEIVGIEGLVMNNNAQVYNGGTGSNKSVSMVGSANVCGTVRYGKGYTKTANNGSENAPANCAAGRTFVESAPITYPPVALPAEIATKNSDSRLASADRASDSARGNVSWSESKRELTLSYGELTLEGTLPYFLCKLVLGGGGVLRSGAGKAIRVFFDEPTSQKCPGLNGAPQLQIANGTSVTADSNHGPGFYFLGSSTAGESKIELGGGSQVSQFVVYAPRSKITANNGVSLNGAIIGQTLELGGGASINKAGTFTPPSSTEFVAPEKIKEEVPQTTSKEELTSLGTHEAEKRVWDEKITKITHEIEEINRVPILEWEVKLTKELEHLAYWISLGTPTPGNESNTSFEKSGFTECTATPPHGEGTSNNPAAGC